MALKDKKDKRISGKTYSLHGPDADTDQYYRIIRDLAALFLEKCPDAKELLLLVRKAGGKGSFFKRRSGDGHDRLFVSFIKKRLADALSVYTAGVKEHLKNLTLVQKTDPTLKTREEQYHLYMLEIELVNRIYRQAFRSSAYKFALLPHCLRDFRPECRAVHGDIESVCRGCTEECFINIGSVLLKKYHIDPYISVSMDLEKLFKELKSRHPDIGALGIACVPELVMGMRLCIKLGIPPVGIPLDANRCSRWMGKCRESSFNLKEMEELLR